MGLVIGGFCIMAMPVGLGWWMASGSVKEGKSARPAVRYLTRSGTMYMGFLLVLMGVSEPLGEVAFAALFIAAAVIAVRLLLKLRRALRNLPGAVRDIGDPAAWRGER